jgi:hypothetical protein
VIARPMSDAEILRWLGLSDYIIHRPDTLGWSVREARERKADRAIVRGRKRLARRLASTGLAGIGCRLLTDPRKAKP